MSDIRDELMKARKTIAAKSDEIARLRHCGNALADLVRELIETEAGDPIADTDWDADAIAALAAWENPQ